MRRQLQPIPINRFIRNETQIFVVSSISLSIPCQISHKHMVILLIITVETKTLCAFKFKWNIILRMKIERKTIALYWMCGVLWFEHLWFQINFFPFFFLMWLVISDTNYTRKIFTKYFLVAYKILSHEESKILKVMSKFRTYVNSHNHNGE